MALNNTELKVCWGKNWAKKVHYWRTPSIRKGERTTQSQFPTQKRNKSIFIQDMRDDIECNKIDLWWDMLKWQYLNYQTETNTLQYFTLWKGKYFSTTKPGLIYSKSVLIADHIETSNKVYLYLFSKELFLSHMLIHNLKLIPTSQTIKPVHPKGNSVLNMHWKDWCWSWNSKTLVIWCEELTHWKKPWCWERLKAGGEGDYRERDGWMASLTQWTWVWASLGS